MLHQLMNSCPEHPRIHHIAEYCAATLLANRMQSNRVPLCPLELLIANTFLPQPVELREQSIARNVFLFRRRCDVRHEHARELMLTTEGMNSVRERLPVAELVEESPA